MKIAEPILLPLIDEPLTEIQPASPPNKPSQLDILPQSKKATTDNIPQILAEVIIEEVSIDGMCGVY